MAPERQAATGYSVPASPSCAVYWFRLRHPEPLGPTQWRSIGEHGAALRSCAWRVPVRCASTPTGASDIGSRGASIQAGLAITPLAGQGTGTRHRRVGRGWLSWKESANHSRVERKAATGLARRRVTILGVGYWVSCSHCRVASCSLGSFPCCLVWSCSIACMIDALPMCPAIYAYG